MQVIVDSRILGLTGGKTEHCQALPRLKCDQSQELGPWQAYKIQKRNAKLDIKIKPVNEAQNEFKSKGIALCKPLFILKYLG